MFDIQHLASKHTKIEKYSTETLQCVNKMSTSLEPKATLDFPDCILIDYVDLCPFREAISPEHVAFTLISNQPHPSKDPQPPEPI